MEIDRCFFGFGFVFEAFSGAVARRIRIFFGSSVSKRTKIPIILSALVRERVTKNEKKTIRVEIQQNSKCSELKKI